VEGGDWVRLSSRTQRCSAKGGDPPAVRIEGLVSEATWRSRARRRLRHTAPSSHHRGRPCICCNRSCPSSTSGDPTWSCSRPYCPPGLQTGSGPEPRRAPASAGTLVGTSNASCHLVWRQNELGTSRHHGPVTVGRPRCIWDRSELPTCQSPLSRPQAPPRSDDVTALCYPRVSATFVQIGLLSEALGGHRGACCAVLSIIVPSL
jgi:hypothetical protein